MKEDTRVRQRPDERKRRWFSSAQFDLIVWLNDDRTFGGFELCYDKGDNEHSIVWHPASGFSHVAVDDGENRPGRYKATPIYVSDGYFDARRIYSAFKDESHALPADVAAYVLRVLETHPDWHAEAAKGD